VRIRRIEEVSILAEKALTFRVTVVIDHEDMFVGEYPVQAPSENDIIIVVEVLRGSDRELVAPKIATDDSEPSASPEEP
jgi:hypothetical protein